MNARGPLAILLLAALALAAWLALSGEEARQVSGPVAGTGQAAESPLSKEPTIAAATQSSPAERAPERVAIPSAPERLGAAATIELRVIGRSDRRPVVGAEVWVLADADAPPLPPSDAVRGGWDHEAWVREHGQRFTSDPDGRVRVPDRGKARVIARAGPLYGEQWLPASDRPSEGIEVVVEQDRTLRLRAVTADGAPVPDLDFTLRYWARFADQLHQKTSAPFGKSDDDGRFALHHAQHWIWDLVKNPDVEHRIVQVCAHALGIDASTSFSVDAWPEQELLLQIPPSGSIVIELRGPQSEHEYVSLRLAGVEDPNAGRNERTEAGRRARFGHVALGRRFRASLTNADRVHCDVIGPIAPGQTVEGVLVIPEPEIVLRFRLVDERLQPIAGAAVHLQAKYEHGSGSTGVVTDAEGVAVHSLWDLLRGQRLTLLELEVSATDDRPVLRGRLEPDCVPQPGVNDLGDVQLSAPPVLASGQVVGAAPALLQGAELFTESASIRPSDGAIEWTGLRGASTTWSDGCRFELRGRTASSRLRLTLVGPELPPHPPIDCATGTRDLRIEYVVLGGVELRLLLDEPADATGLHTVLVPLEAQKLPGAKVVQTWSPNSGEGVKLDSLESLEAEALRDPLGLRRWSGLVPGRYRIELRSGTSPDPLLPGQEIAVRAAETTRAPDIDLRRRLKRIRIELQDEHGVRLTREAGAIALRRATDPNATWCGEVVPEGIFELVTIEPVDFAIFADGFRPLDLDRVQEDRKLSLTPGSRVRVQFDLSAIALPAGSRCSVWLSKSSTTLPQTRFRTSYRTGQIGVLPAPSPSGPTPIGADGMLTWRVGEPGEYSLSFRSDSPDRRFVAEPHRITVTDAPEQEFKVKVRLQ